MSKCKIIAVLALFLAQASYADVGAKAYIYNISEKIGPRNPAYYRNLERAADYIKREFAKSGYIPQEQFYTLRTRPDDKRSYRNIIAVKEGQAEKNKVIIVCSHYDTFRDAPGADDNNSGTAAVLELARRARNENTAKTIKFITFTNEELELVTEDSDMGSYRYAEEARKRGEDIEAVICIDMIGYFSDKPGSQYYPIPFNFFYPNKGNFIGFGADLASLDLLTRFVGEFRKHSDIPTESIVAPAPFVPQIMTSDNRPFWTFGYKSVWVTDTCIFRNPYMHSKKDRFDTLDYTRMDKVIDGVYGALLKLSK